MRTQQKQRVETFGDPGLSNNTTGILEQKKQQQKTVEPRLAEKIRHKKF